MKMWINPYGWFDAIEKKTAGMQNCDDCWFGQRKNDTSHCPHNVKCVIRDRKGKFITAFVFVKKIDEEKGK